MYELEAFDPKWQLHYKTIALAAKAANVLIMYTDWLTTDDGKRYTSLMRGVPDTLAQNLAALALRKDMSIYGEDYSQAGETDDNP